MKKIVLAFVMAVMAAGSAMVFAEEPVEYVKRDSVVGQAMERILGSVILLPGYTPIIGSEWRKRDGEDRYRYPFCYQEGGSFHMLEMQVDGKGNTFVCEGDDCQAFPE